MAQQTTNQMMSGSDFISTKPELSGLKSQKIIASVFEGKTPLDYETAWSPTSPLDFRVFSSFGNPFSGSFPSRSIKKMHHKSWDSGKVGLSILDDDYPCIDSTRILLPSVDSKNIIFGSLMRNVVKIVTQEGKSLNVGVVEVGSTSRDIGVKKQSLGSVDEDVESNIEVSEDYTCVTEHGPNPKTTHFYGDGVVETVECDGMKKGCCGNKKESLFVIASLELDTDDDELVLSSDFLSYCWSCGKRLGMGKDIYMYRGYKAFCSSECRWKEIEEDEKMEKDKEDEAAAKCGSSSDKDVSKKKSTGVTSTMA